MTRRTCREVEALIDREALGFNDAERLCVEQHLGECASCRETLALSRFVREAALSASSTLSPPARERAMSRAFASVSWAKVHRVRAARVSRPWLWRSALGATAAAAALVFVFWRGGPDPIAKKRPGPQVPAFTVAKAPQTSAEPPSEPAWIEARAIEQRTFAHAVVTLEPATRVRFDEQRVTLALERGRADIDVDVSKGRPFSVTTQHFRVQVLGTRFVVTPETVFVRRGRVQVFGLDGRVLARDLGAGASFSYGQKKAPVEKEAPEAHELTVSELLARAREELAHGNPKSARKLAIRAEESHPERAERAEASTLRAEAALLEHDAKSALVLYESVAERYPDLAAGENAAFAAAQLATRVDKARARALLARYLELHPRGRFADEAKRRMSELAAP